VECHVNHRGWMVLHSVESDDRRLCVDFFEDSEGQFGLQLLRADPEDGGRWQSLALYGATRYASLLDTAQNAAKKIVWLTTPPRVGASFGTWQRQIALR
jgi:hypothetical protein